MEATSDRATERDGGRTNLGDASPSLLSATLEAASKKAADGPAWLGALRREGARWLEAHGFPKPNEEAWRFTPIRNLLRVPYAREAGNAAAAAGAGVLPGYDAPELVLVNGRPQGALPDLPGVEIRTLSDVLAKTPDRLEPYLGRLVRTGDGFSATNLALFDDGLFIVARRGSKVGPFHLVVVSAPGSTPTLATPRVVVVAEPASELTLVESRYVAGGAPHLESAATEVFLEDGARVAHARIHRGAANGASVATLAVSQGRNSRFLSRVFTFGGLLARLDVRVALRGEGAECTLDGLYTAQSGDLVDHQTTIDHESPRCSSRERYKGAIDGGGVAVFDGTVVVRKGASGTESHQENRNLCLSPDAVVHAKPHLEIDTDDVKCSHGATVGRLDPAQLFYLRARGIDADLARSVLTYAFAREMVERVEDGGLRGVLEGALASLLPAGAIARGLA